MYNPKMLYPEIEKIKIQNYACQGCSNCSNLKAIDLRTREGVFTYLIKKRSCYLNRLQAKITNLQQKAHLVEKEVKNYQIALKNEVENRNRSNF